MNTIIKNLAGICRIWKPAYFMLIALLALSCTEDKIGQPSTDGIAPSALKSAEARPLPGGAFITYVLPDDDTDIAYVKGEYVVDGEARTVSTSVYKNYLIVEGMDSNVSVDVDLYVVDHSQNISAPLKVSFTTSDAPYATIGNSITASPSIGGIVVRWENPEYANVGIVLEIADTITGEMKANAISFASGGAAFFAFPAKEQRFGLYAIDPWGHYSETKYFTLAPVPEQWLNRRLMSEHYVGNDNRELMTPNPNDGYYSAISILFDSIGYCFNPGNNSYNSSKNFITGPNNPDTGLPWTFPFCITIDLGVTADVTRFWMEPRTHSTTSRFWEHFLGAPYEFEFWGTETDFADPTSANFIPKDDPYWSDSPYAIGTWQQDPRWKFMGRYYNRRISRPNDTPWTLTTPGQQSNWVGTQDPDWIIDKNIKAMGNGVRYLADGSGPIDNNETFFPDAGYHFAITQIAVGPVRYVRWKTNSVWDIATTYLQAAELWFWGGIISETE
jgi:hypothetical protein